MSTTTPLLTLVKPAVTDAALISVLNTNFDILDNAVTLAGAQTLTNKIITSPTISTPTLTGTVVVSSATLGALVNGALTSVTATLAANETYANATHDVTGCSVALTTGTWMVWAWLSILNNAVGAANHDVRIWDGTSAALASASTGLLTNIEGALAMGPAVVVLVAPNTYKLSLVSTSASNSSVLATTGNAAYTKATGITALRLA